MNINDMVFSGEFGLGKIIFINVEKSLLVEFKEYMGGHTGGGMGKNGHCWWCSAKELVLCVNIKII